MAYGLNQALIVDDSRTAAVTLSKMLDKHGIATATVESGEGAIHYLQSGHPDVIFMDHMMPGMDGFDAVKAIKSDPEKSTIPIIMYTSRGGEIYLGQARALGAMGILTKPPAEPALLSLLEKLRATRPAATPKPTPKPTSVFNGSDTMELDAHAIAMAADLSSRRARSGGDSGVAAGAAGEGWRSAPVTTPEPSFWGSRRQWSVALIFLLSTMWLLYLYLPAQQQLQQQQQQNRALLNALQWSLNQERHFDYGQEPLSDDLAGLLGQLLPKLTQAGFRGKVVLEGHIGEFCLTRVRLSDGSPIAMLPPAELPISGCESIGYSAIEAARQSVLQSPAFSDFLKTSGVLLDDAPVRVSIVAMGSRVAKYPYPSDLQGLTAGDWNTIALRNNRIHIYLLADSALN